METMANELIKQQEMTPAVWDMLKSIAETTAMAKVEQAKIAKHLLFCLENELPLSLAVNGGLYTVNNRVEVEGTVIRAQIRKHPDYDYIITRLDEKGAEIAIMFQGQELGRAGFTEDDAKKADLMGKDNYKKFPTDMFLNRATSRAYKRYCPDIFMQSVYVRGEIQGNDPAVIEGVIVPSIDDLIKEYGHDAVLSAANASGGDLGAMAEWLEAQP
jgi:hypothetical protein